MFRIVKQDEKTRNVKSTSISGDMINMRSISQNDTLVNDERGFIVETVFDFADVPLENVYLAAAEFALIEWRRKGFKKAKNPEGFTNGPFSALGFLPQVKLSAKEQASNFIMANVSKEELKAMLEQMENTN